MMIRYMSQDNNIYEIVAYYTRDKEPDTWVKYRNVETLKEFTCRKEAFDHRFSPVFT